MFNEKQKRGYIEVRAKSNDKRVLQSIESLFEDIEWYEEKNNTDICNVKITEYADIILQSKNVSRLSYLSNMQRILMEYRQYCIQRKFIDIDAFMSQMGDPPRITNRQLIKKLAAYKAKNPAAEIRTPEKLFALLKEDVFREADYYDKTTKTIAYDAIYLLIYMFAFFGITGQDFVALKHSDIKIESKAATIHKDGKRYLITGETVKILENCLKAKVVKKAGGRRVIIKYTDEEYPFVLSGNNSDAKGEYRRHYQSMQSIIKNSEVEIPRIVDVAFRGRIYKMCMEAKKRSENGGYEVQSLLDNEIIALYEESNSIQSDNHLTNFQQRYEIISDFKSTYEHINDNDMW